MVRHQQQQQQKAHTLTMGICGKIVPKHDQSNDTHFFLAAFDLT